MSDSRNYRESGLTENNMKYHNGGGTNRLSAISGTPVVYHSVGATPGRNRVVPDQQKIVRSTPVISDSVSRILDIHRTDIPDDIKDFMLEPQANQQLNLPLFRNCSPSTEFLDCAHALMEHIEAVAKFVHATIFLTKNVPIVGTIEEYLKVFEENASPMELIYQQELEVHNADESDLLERRRRVVYEERTAIHDRELLRIVPDSESTTARKERTTSLAAADLEVERVSNRMNTLRNDERYHKKDRGRVLLAYTLSQQSMRELATEKRQKANHAIARIHGAVDMICKEIEKILLLPAFNLVKAHLEMSRPDPANPLEASRDQLKERNLVVIH